MKHTHNNNNNILNTLWTQSLTVKSHELHSFSVVFVVSVRRSNDLLMSLFSANWIFSTWRILLVALFISLAYLSTVQYVADEHSFLIGFKLLNNNEQKKKKEKTSKTTMPEIAPINMEKSIYAHQQTTKPICCQTFTSNFQPNTESPLTSRIKVTSICTKWMARTYAQIKTKSFTTVKLIWSWIEQQRNTQKEIRWPW